MKSLGSILVNLDNCRNDAEVISFLQNIGQKYSTTLQVILRGAFDPSIKFLLPEGVPSYKPVEPQSGALLYSMKKLTPFIDGFYPGLKQMKREHLFIEMMSTLLDEDAALVVAMKDKKTPHPKITKKIVLKAFPALF